MRRILFVLSLLMTGIDLRAQQTFPVNGTTVPRHISYAFTNASVYADYKTPCNKATLLVRDGLVADIGPAVSDASTDIRPLFLFNW